MASYLMLLLKGKSVGRISSRFKQYKAFRKSATQLNDCFTPKNTKQCFAATNVIMYEIKSFRSRMLNRITVHVTLVLGFCL